MKCGDIKEMHTLNSVHPSSKYVKHDLGKLCIEVVWLIKQYNIYFYLFFPK
jgi:hypothetical protein